MTTILPTTHAALGASSSHRWMECAGSVRLSEGIPDSSSPYAREGTAAHELAAECLTRGGNAADRVGDTITVTEQEDGEDVEYPIEVTEEMATAVQTYVDAVREKAAMGNVVRIETRFDLSPLDPPAPMFGTADAVIYRREDKHLFVDDYKHGQGVIVEAENNPQLMYYALGAVVDLQAKPDEITVTIHQPRGRTDETVRGWTFSWDDLLAFKKELFEAAARTQEDDAPLNPGDHCRFCPALPVCPAQKQQAMDVAQTEFDTDGNTSLVDPDQLDDATIRRVLDKKDDIVKWLRSVEDHVRTRMEQGESFEGYKLVEKRATRKWIDDEAAQNYLQRKLGKKAIIVEKLVSPYQAEKAFKAADEEVPGYLDTLYEAKSSGYNLAPDSSPKPAVDLLEDAQGEFEADA